MNNFFMYLKRERHFFLALALALLLGVLIAWIDSQPHWDDTGITVAILLVVSLCFGVAAPRRAWLYAIFLSVWIPIAGIVLQHNYSSFFALVPAFLGAGVGAFARKLFSSATHGKNE